MAEQSRKSNKRSIWRTPAFLRGLAFLPPLALFLLLALSISTMEPPQERPASQAQDVRLGHMDILSRMRLWTQIVRWDEQWWRQAESFPDTWSQHDHYHNLMRRHLLGLASRKNTNLSQLFLIYEEGLRKGWPGPGGQALEATWPKLKPRTE